MVYMAMLSFNFQAHSKVLLNNLLSWSVKYTASEAGFRENCRKSGLNLRPPARFKTLSQTGFRKDDSRGRKSPGSVLSLYKRRDWPSDVITIQPIKQVIFRQRTNHNTAFSYKEPIKIRKLYSVEL